MQSTGLCFSLRIYARIAVLLFVVALANGASAEGYVGRDVCAGCHKTVAATQVRTAMARTWQGKATKQLPANYSATQIEGSDPTSIYVVKRAGQSFDFQVQMSGRQPLTIPIETIVGGERHGLSFLLRLHDLDGLSLPRSPLIEARYLHYFPENRLAISPGFPKDKPQQFETGAGSVLMPTFERKCLTCHGEPRQHGTHIETGVSCENCHGPGQSHLTALERRSAEKGILNPRKLPVTERMQSCSQCHAGFSKVEDPMPDDLLISSQVTALSSSECWRQSAGQITCTDCHNPHQDAPRAALILKSERICLQCHGENIGTHAGLCPVNRTSACVGCHMADETRSPFVIADHWIRVHPEQNVRVTQHSEKWRTQMTPRHLYLRMIALGDAAKASEIRKQLVEGASFFELSRTNSIDRRSTFKSGYLGDLDPSQIDAGFAPPVLRLQPGELSDIIQANGRYLIFQRMPRNFREDAEKHFNRAMQLRKESKRDESTAELLEALKIYPHLLRALTYLGISYGDAGNPQTGADILTLATQIYPRDAGAHFNLGIAYGLMGKEGEIAEYKRALEIDPDCVLAFLNWGAALYGKGQYKEAIQVYRDGININPLIASLHYSLGVALEQDNQSELARNEFELARKIDPNAGTH
jgi:predicted CXXCH cytochrome family protein